MNTDTEMVELTLERIVRKTPTGWMVAMDDDWESLEYFLPESQVHMNEEELTCRVPRWLIVQRGLDNYVD